MVKEPTPPTYSARDKEGKRILIPEMAHADRDAMDAMGKALDPERECFWLGMDARNLSMGGRAKVSSHPTKELEDAVKRAVITRAVLMDSGNEEARDWAGERYRYDVDLVLGHARSLVDEAVKKGEYEQPSVLKRHFSNLLVDRRRTASTEVAISHTLQPAILRVANLQVRLHDAEVLPKREGTRIRWETQVSANEGDLGFSSPLKGGGTCIELKRGAPLALWHMFREVANNPRICSESAGLVVDKGEGQIEVGGMPLEKVEDQESGDQATQARVWRMRQLVRNLLNSGAKSVYLTDYQFHWLELTKMGEDDTYCLAYWKLRHDEDDFLRGKILFGLFWVFSYRHLLYFEKEEEAKGSEETDDVYTPVVPQVLPWNLDDTPAPSNEVL